MVYSGTSDRVTTSHKDTLQSIILLGLNFQEEDNLPTKDNMATPKVFFTRRFNLISHPDCSIHILQWNLLMLWDQLLCPHHIWFPLYVPTNLTSSNPLKFGYKTTRLHVCVCVVGTRGAVKRLCGGSRDCCFLSSSVTLT